MRGNGLSGLRPAAVGLGALVLLIVAYLFIAAGDRQGSGSPEDAPASESSSPPSTEETAADSASAEPTAPAATDSPEPPLPSTTTPPAASETLVHVAIAEYNAATQAIEISAGAPGIPTDAGVCVVNATNGAATVSTQQEAEFDGHGASCGLMALSVAGQPAGEWQVSVSFTSPKGDAVSEPLTVVTT